MPGGRRLGQAQWGRAIFLRQVQLMESEDSSLAPCKMTRRRCQWAVPSMRRRGIRLGQVAFWWAFSGPREAEPGPPLEDFEDFINSWKWSQVLCPPRGAGRGCRPGTVPSLSGAERSCHAGPGSAGGGRSAQGDPESWHPPLYSRAWCLYDSVRWRRLPSSPLTGENTEAWRLGARVVWVWSLHPPHVPTPVPGLD